MAMGCSHNTSTRLIGAATAKDAWLILFWFLRQFYVIERQIAAESTFFKYFSIIWKPSQAFYAVAATVALCVSTAHTMAKGPSNKNFCHSTSFSILWGGKKPKKMNFFLGNEGNYDHERNFIHEYDLNL